MQRGAGGRCEASASIVCQPQMPIPDRRCLNTPAHTGMPALAAPPTRAAFQQINIIRGAAQTEQHGASPAQHRSVDTAVSHTSTQPAWHAAAGRKQHKCTKWPPPHASPPSPRHSLQRVLDREALQQRSSRPVVHCRAQDAARQLQVRLQHLGAAAGAAGHEQAQPIAPNRSPARVGARAAQHTLASQLASWCVLMRRMAQPAALPPTCASDRRGRGGASRP